MQIYKAYDQQLHTRAYVTPLKQVCVHSLEGLIIALSEDALELALAMADPKAQGLLTTAWNMETGNLMDAVTGLDLSCPYLNPLAQKHHAFLCDLDKMRPIERYQTLGDCLFKRGYMQRSVHFYEKALKLEPSSKTYNNMALAMHMMGQQDGLEAYWLKAIAHARTIAEQVGSCYNLVKYYRGLGYHEKALALIDQMPEDDALWLQKGHIYLQLKNTEKAQVAYRQAYEMAPGDAILSPILEGYLKHNHLAKADELLETFRASQFKHFHYYRARIDQAAKRTEIAIDILETNGKDHEQDWMWWLLLSRCYRDAKQIIKAMHAISHILEPHQTLPEVLWEKAQIAKQAGRYQDFNHWVEALLKLWKQDIRQRLLDE